MRVRFPSGWLPSGGTGRRASLRNSCPLRAWEFKSPLGNSKSERMNKRTNRQTPGRQIGKAASMRGWCLWVRVPLRRLSCQKENMISSRGPLVRPLSYKEEKEVRFLPGRPVANWQEWWSAGVKAAYLIGIEGDRVRFSGRPSAFGPESIDNQGVNRGGWSNGKTPALQAGNRGSTPRLSTRSSINQSIAGVNNQRKVAGYGWPGLFAKECARRGREGSNPLPSAPRW